MKAPNKNHSKQPPARFTAGRWLSSGVLGMTK